MIYMSCNLETQYPHYVYDTFLEKPFYFTIFISFLASMNFLNYNLCMIVAFYAN